MYMSNLSQIREFFCHGGIFLHFMALSHNDTVLLLDFNMRPLIRYTSNGIVQEIDKDKVDQVLDLKANVGKILGRIRLGSPYWEFINEETQEVTVSKYTIDQVEGVLDFEVELSKKWIVDKDYSEEL